MNRTLKVNAYCKQCATHNHLTLSGTDSEILSQRDSYVCSNCIIQEAR